MAYTTENPPALITQGIGGGHRSWSYASTDNTASVRQSGYFTNGYTLGMRAGDTLEHYDTNGSPISVRHYIVVSATPTAVDLDDGVAITGADTD